MFRTIAEVEGFLRAREDYERAFRTVHIGGTKGKGSTALFVDEVLRAGGLRTGGYSSPHLERVTERIVVDGEEIGEEAFARAVGKAAAVVERGGEAARASTFDVLTAAAFDHFAERGVEWGVVEVGLGGHGSTRRTSSNRIGEEETLPTRKPRTAPSGVLPLPRKGFLCFL